MERLTTLDELQRHMRILAMVEETHASFISCYLDLEPGESSYRRALAERVSTLRQVLTGPELEDLEEALVPIDAYLATKILPEAKGAAFFVRPAIGGAFFLPLQFRAPLPNWIAVDPTPNLYHLVELKDTYHRYVVMLATREWVRILEVNLGSVTEQVWTERPDLRERVGRDWTKEHYQSHRQGLAARFLKEQVCFLEQLLTAGGYTHLILTGTPHITAMVRQALSKESVAKLINTLPASGSETLSNVVTTTLSAFIAREEQESQAVADQLLHEIYAHGLATIGTAATIKALSQGQVDVLVMAKEYLPEPGWACTACGTMGIVAHSMPAVCPTCEKKALRLMDIKEEIARLAEQQGCQVEVVKRNPTLLQLGGVGCLLRYRMDSGPSHRDDL